jgi:transcriptional regulator with XRE-family HTH domain
VEIADQMGLTPLADAVGISLIQGSRYESGQSQPTLDVIRRLALALGVSADELVFGDAEKGPDEELRLQFEAISRFTPEERQIAKALLDSLIRQHEARRWTPRLRRPARPAERHRSESAVR